MATIHRWQSLKNRTLHKMQLQRLQIFKSQDFEKGAFDVNFEIQGKRIYANKSYLTSLTEYFTAQLSDRWNTEEVVRVTQFSFDDFFQLLCFLYAATCDISTENVATLLEMADFYGVEHLKDFCDGWLNFFVGTHEEDLHEDEIVMFWELAQRYSLPKMTQTVLEELGRFSFYDFEDDVFLKYKKPMILLILKYAAHPKAFSILCNWVEHQATLKKEEDEDFDQPEFVKNEMLSIFAEINLSKMYYSGSEYFNFFAKHLVFDNEVLQIALESEKEAIPDQGKMFFMEVYTYAEKVVAKEHDLSEDSNFDVYEAMKTQLSSAFALIWKEEKNNLKEYLVDRQILTQEEINSYCHVQVECSEDGRNGIKLTGDFIDTYGIAHAFLKASEDNSPRTFFFKSQSGKMNRFSAFKFAIPKNSSKRVSKMKGAEWYLLLEKDGSLALKHKTLVRHSDYLIAEMKTLEDEYAFDDEVRHCLSISRANV